jgi:molybdenum cofactor cytidylyltransferase
VGFAADHRAALLALRGDAGARALLAADPAAVTAVAVDDPGAVRDVDRPDDLSRRACS